MSRMPKPKKKPHRTTASKGPALPALAPQVLEQAAQGWLQSSGAPAPSPRPAIRTGDHRLTTALTETLAELRSEIAELRSRIDRLENR